MKFNKLFVVVIVALTFVFGCKDNGCGDSCGAGVCDDGTCICDPGWVRDATGSCSVQDLCFQTDCGEHGQCNTSNGDCVCDEGWTLDNNNKCNKADPCYQVDCGVHGTCNSTTGNCDCDFGYEVGNDGKCSVEIRDNYLGFWTGSHTNDLGQSSGVYTMEVDSVTNDVTKVLVKNFMDYYCSPLNQPFDVYATLGVFGVEFTSLCSQYQTNGIYDQVTFLDPNTLKVKVFITSGGSGWNLEGIYTRD